MDVDLLAWLDAPHPARGVRFARDDGGWERVGWEAAARRVHAASALVAEHRREPGGPVAIVAPVGIDFLALFFGALHAGNTPCPLPPPNVLQDPDAYSAHVAALLAVADPSLIVASEQHLPLVAEAARRAGARAPVPAQLADDAGEAPRQPSAELALMQFTSGSSGRPRAARVTWTNLAGNVELMHDPSFADPDESALATWLPHYHDMGLIGGIVAPAAIGADLWIMRPEQFVRDPLRWLECFGRDGCTHGAAPSSGLAHVLRRVRADDLHGLDFSGWRGVIVGAERIDAAILSRFAEHLGPFGLPPSAVIGAYGMAEATLLVAWSHAQAAATTVRVDLDRLRLGEPVAVEDETAIGDVERVGDGAGWLVSCGWAQRGVGLAVVGEDGEELPEGRLGELLVTGRCVTAGYHGDDPVRTSRFAGGGLRTGDAGFLHHGELYVVGRIADCVELAERTLFAEHLEARLGRIEGIGVGRCAVVAGRDDDGPLVAVVVEARPGDWVAPARSLLDAELGSGARAELLSGRPGAIARTSSGKPRRRVMWRALRDGTLAADPVRAAGEPAR